MHLAIDFSHIDNLRWSTNQVRKRLAGLTTAPAAIFENAIAEGCTAQPDPAPGVLAQVVAMSRPVAGGAQQAETW